MDILKIRQDVNSPWESILAIKGEQGPIGETGPQGEQGPAGEAGEPGAAGYTPIKGTDYWTAEDQAQIVEDVLAALPSSEEVQY